MYFLLVPVLTVLATSSSVVSIDWNQLFVRNTTQNRAIVSDCSTVNNRRRCKLNTKNLKLDTVEKIEIISTEDGFSIKCSKKNKKKGRWYGNCDGDANDANFISRVDDRGTKSVFGSIQVGNTTCLISPSIDGEEVITCIPNIEFMDEDVSLDAPKPESFDEDLTSQYRFGFTPAQNQIHANRFLRVVGQQNYRRRLYDDLGETIDVLVVWTKKAECNNAGLLSGCTLTAATEHKMRGLIDLAVAETNTAFELSGIFSSLRLVHAYRDPDYIESNDITNSLRDVTAHGDGLMDGVHVKRALYGADIVHLIVGTFILRDSIV